MNCQIQICMTWSRWSRKWHHSKEGEMMASLLIFWLNKKTGSVLIQIFRTQCLSAQHYNSNEKTNEYSSLLQSKIQTSARKLQNPFLHVKEHHRLVHVNTLWHPSTQTLCTTSFYTQTHVGSQGSKVNRLHWSATRSFVGTRGVTLTVFTTAVKWSVFFMHFLKTNSCRKYFFHIPFDYFVLFLFAWKECISVKW